MDKVIERIERLLEESEESMVTAATIEEKKFFEGECNAYDGALRSFRDEGYCW